MKRFYLSCSAVFAAFAAPCAIAGAPVEPAAAAPAAHHGITPLKDAAFAQDEDVKCLQSALETGNPDTGPSTFMLKAPAGCRVPAHFHSAEEQLIVIRGTVATGMKGTPTVTLTAGGFAVMPGKTIHWFSCEGKEPCLMVVSFNRNDGVGWVDAHPNP